MKKGIISLVAMLLVVLIAGMPANRVYANGETTEEEGEIRKITYNLMGGTNAAANPEHYVPGETVTFQNPSKTSYTFLGWYADADYKEKVEGIDETETEDIMLYAKWKAIDYKITYKLNGGTNAKDNPISYTVESKKITLQDPTRSGYYFAGWQTGGKDQNTISSGTSENITFTAKWVKYKQSVYLTRETMLYKTNSKKTEWETGKKDQLYYSSGVTKGSYTAIMNVVTKETGFVRTKYITTKKPTTKIVQKTKTYYDYLTMEKDLKNLADTYPQWMEVKSIGKTVDSRKMYCAIIGNKKAEKQMIVTVSMHARENLNTLFVMKQIEEYMNKYQTKSAKIGMSYEKLFNEVCLYIVPMVNPDGVTISQYGPSALNSKSLQKSVRNILKGKSYKTWKNNARGVNLNRNFPTKWKVNTAARKPDSIGYAGKSGASEKETKAIIKLFDSLSNPVGSIAYHSMGNLADWNMNKKSKYYAVNKQMGETTKKLTGYKYPAYDLAAGAGGTMGTWLSNGKREMPNITIETGNVACPLPYSYYNRLWKDNRYVIESLTKIFY